MTDKEWHSKNRMPPSPSRSERIEWHAKHAAQCGCRPVPASLAEDVQRALGTGGTRSGHKSYR